MPSPNLADILAKISINEATGETVTTTEEAIYSVGATLTTPGFASPKGNLVYFGSNLLEPVFASVIIVAFAAWALTALADRRADWKVTGHGLRATPRS